MLRKLPILLLVGTLIGVIVCPVVVRAGGWTVVTLDHTPNAITANQPFTIGFMVRAHGKTPVDGLNPTVTLTPNDPSAATPVIVRATAEGAVGHYVATITLPQAGTWYWTINTFGQEAEMSPLTVAAPAAVGSPIAVTQSIQVWAWSITAVVLISATALLVVRRTRRVGVQL